MLDSGGVARAAMKGSWAGAMGGPQFLPSAFLKYATSYTGPGSPDIWNNLLDSLASIANFLRQSGWEPGLSWGTEAILPKNFGFASLHGSFAAFAAQGVKSANGDPFSARRRDLVSSLRRRRSSFPFVGKLLDSQGV